MYILIILSCISTWNITVYVRNDDYFSANPIIVPTGISVNVRLRGNVMDVVWNLNIFSYSSS